MSKYFRPWNIDQTAASAAECAGLRAERPCVRGLSFELVRESLDLKRLPQLCDGLGQPPLTAHDGALLLPAMRVGCIRSRRMRRPAAKGNDFVMIVALDPPDFRTISDFPQAHLKALRALFCRFLKLCETAGLVKLGTCAGWHGRSRRMRRNTKRNEYERMKKREAELQSRVARMLAAARLRIAKRTRLRQRHALATSCRTGLATSRNGWRRSSSDGRTGAEPRQAAEEERRIEAERNSSAKPKAARSRANRRAPPSEEPNPQGAAHFTDPESRIMKSRMASSKPIMPGRRRCRHQVIVAHELTQCGSDQGQLVPLIEPSRTSRPQAGAGLSGLRLLAAKPIRGARSNGIDGYVAPGRASTRQPRTEKNWADR